MGKTTENKQEIIKLLKAGIKYRDIINKHKISRQTLHKWSIDAGLEPRKKTEQRICKYCNKPFIAQYKSNKAYCRGCYHKYLKETKQSESYNSMRLAGLSVRQWQRKAREVASNYIKLQAEWRVHHLDGDITNNNASNLFVFFSQSLHLAYHHRLKQDKRCKPKVTDGFYCK